MTTPALSLEERKKCFAADIVVLMTKRKFGELDTREFGDRFRQSCMDNELCMLCWLHETKMVDASWKFGINTDCKACHEDPMIKMPAVCTVCDYCWTHAMGIMQTCVHENPAMVIEPVRLKR